MTLRRTIVTALITLGGIGAFLAPLATQSVQAVTTTQSSVAGNVFQHKAMTITPTTLGVWNLTATTQADDGLAAGEDGVVTFTTERTRVGEQLWLRTGERVAFTMRLPAPLILTGTQTSTTSEWKWFQDGDVFGFAYTAKTEGDQTLPYATFTIGVRGAAEASPDQIEAAVIRVDLNIPGDRYTSKHSSATTVFDAARRERFTAVYAAHGASFALTNSGILYGWGAGLVNGLGSTASVPTAIDLPGKVVQVSTGAGDTPLILALLEDGRIYAWGYGGRGGFGNSEFTTMLPHSSLPILAATYGEQMQGKVVQVSAGPEYGLALTDAGFVYSWGWDSSLNLGRPFILLPPNRIGYVDRVPGVEGAIAISAGAQHALATLTNGTAMGWGANQNYAIDTTGITAYLVAQVARPFHDGITGNLAVAGSGVSWSLRDDGVHGVGSNNYGQLGLGTSMSAKTPTLLVDLPAGLSALRSAGYNSAYAISGDREQVYWWGDSGETSCGKTIVTGAGQTGSSFSRTPVPITKSSSAAFRDAAFSDSHGLQLYEDGTLWATGCGASGQLGNGALPASMSTPVQVLLPALRSSKK